MRKVELLAPAKNLEIAIAAIDNGADAVYLGAPSFGARKAAGNSMADIGKLVEYAHRFYCKVFVTLNTILYDAELAEAEALIKQLYRIGTDALIIQDPAILELDIPPISLHASTQMHNYDPERIKFLDNIGFQRIVLARELSLEQLRAIRKEVNAELEVFIHGALCVSMSGQCYLSQYMFGRSANRGECAQPCRMKWSVKDSDGKVVIRDKYALSLRDLNLTDYLKDLVEIGIDSFKIEGRLKDENYVANIVNHYNSQLNGIIKNNPSILRSGSGNVTASFTADPERSFNRGYTNYFTVARQAGMVNMDTPKSMGKPIGCVLQVKGNTLTIESKEPIHNGDGLCYLDKGELKGIKVNSAEGNRIICNETVNVRPGTMLYRNYDHRFVMSVEKMKSVRKIGIVIKATEQNGQLLLSVRDENGITAEILSEDRFEKATNSAQKERILQQLGKCGDSIFSCESVEYSGEILFIPAGVVNGLRRNLLEKLEHLRETAREQVQMGEIVSGVTYGNNVDWHCNVVNEKAASFYRKHGAKAIEKGFEVNQEQKGKELMHTRYCLLYEMGRCRKQNNNKDLKFPLYICNDKHQFQLEFDCAECFMKIIS